MKKTKLFLVFLIFTFVCITKPRSKSSEYKKIDQTEKIEGLELDIILYEKLVQNDPESLAILNKAFNQKGIVGVSNIPGHKEKYAQFIKAARQFNALSEEQKESYKPDRSSGQTFLGYEAGKEKFQRPDGTWVVDNLKTSYYAFIPENSNNKWPIEVNLKEPFLGLGQLMANTGELIMQKIGLLDDNTGFTLEKDSRLGRMLYYHQNEKNDNPYFCGAHFDHGLFTVLLPAVYFCQGKSIAEPEDAGLFVRTSKEQSFKKVFATDPEIMLFQIGEFGQLVKNDKIKATEHRVHSSKAPIERYTMAVFFNAPMDRPICSKSILTTDARYGAKSGEPCTYRHWHQASFKRYSVNSDKTS